MPVLKLSGVEAVKAHAGRELGVSGWKAVTQRAVDDFARVTGDHQWIHVDPARAAGTVFGGTIAHGYYTLALVPALSAEIYTIEGFEVALNYGLDRVRFPAPVAVGSRVRLHAAIARVDDIPDGIQVATTLAFERERSDKPVCVAEALARLLTGA